MMRTISRPYKLAYATDLAPSIPPSMTFGGVYNDSERGPVFPAESFLRELQKTLESIFGKGPLPQAEAAGPPGIGRAPGYVFANGGGVTGGTGPGLPGGTKGIGNVFDAFTPYFCQFIGYFGGQEAYARCTGKEGDKPPELIPKAEGATGPSLLQYCNSRCKVIAKGRPYKPRISGTNCHCGISLPPYGSFKCKTNPGCTGSTAKQCCCSSQCKNLAKGRRYNPRVSGNTCYCNFSKPAGSSVSTTFKCKTNPGCTGSTAKQCCCSSQCRKIANGRSMSPRVSGNTCYCNFKAKTSGGGGSSTGGYVSGCGCKSTPGCNSVGGYNSCLDCCCKGQCKKMANGRSYSPRVSGRTCYCNFKSKSSGGGGGSSGGGGGSGGSSGPTAHERCRSRCKCMFPYATLGKNMNPVISGGNCLCRQPSNTPRRSGC